MATLGESQIIEIPFIECEYKPKITKKNLKNLKIL